MRGYTKEELEAKSLNPATYIGCTNCRLHWHRRSFEKHLNVAALPEAGKKQRESAIIHPAWERFIEFLVEGAIKKWSAEEEARRTTGEEREVPLVRETVSTSAVDDGPEVLSIDEAVARLDVSREALLSEFEKSTVPFNFTVPVPARRRRPAPTTRR